MKHLTGRHNRFLVFKKAVKFAVRNFSEIKDANQPVKSLPVKQKRIKGNYRKKLKDL